MQYYGSPVAYPAPVVYQYQQPQVQPAQPVQLPRAPSPRRHHHNARRSSMTLNRGMCCGLSLVIWLVGFALLIIGFATAYWVSADGVHKGLWQHCIESRPDKCETLTFKKLAKFEDSVAGLLIAAIILGFISLLAHIFLPIAALFLFLTGVIGLSAVSLYASEYDDEAANYDLSWSFALTVSGSVILLLNAIVLCIWAGLDGCRMKPTVLNSVLGSSRPDWQRRAHHNDRVRDWQKRSFSGASAYSNSWRRPGRAVPAYPYAKNPYQYSYM